jgi:acyl-CoA thioesterase
VTKLIPEPEEGFNPFGDMLGIVFTDYGEGRSRCELEVRGELVNPHGVLHGGVIYSMADFGMGAAVYSTLDEEELCATVEIKISYVTAVKSGHLACDSRVIDRRRRLATIESEIMNGDDLVAKALGTFYIYDVK